MKPFLSVLFPALFVVLSVSLLSELVHEDSALQRATKRGFLQGSAYERELWESAVDAYSLGQKDAVGYVLMQSEVDGDTNRLDSEVQIIGAIVLSPLTNTIVFGPQGPSSTNGIRKRNDL